MATVGGVMTIGHEIIDDDFRGVMYLLFFIYDCPSCAAQTRILEDIMENIDFKTDHLFIVPHDRDLWIELVRKFKIRGYPSLVKTFNSKLLDIYSDKNIIKVFKTGLID